MIKILTGLDPQGMVPPQSLQAVGISMTSKKQPTLEEIAKKSAELQQGEYFNLAPEEQVECVYDKYDYTDNFVYDENNDPDWMKDWDGDELVTFYFTVDGIQRSFTRQAGKQVIELFAKALLGKEGEKVTIGRGKGKMGRYFIK